MIEQRFRFTLTKRQVVDLEDNLILDDDIVSSGIFSLVNGDAVNKIPTRQRRDK